MFNNDERDCEVAISFSIDLNFPHEIGIFPRNLDFSMRFGDSPILFIFKISHSCIFMIL